MANKRISNEKQALVLAALCEGTPINACCRMFRVGKHSVLRVIVETGEALGAYMDDNFRDLPCNRIAIDEQWQYCGKHGQRMGKVKDERKGDFWLWCAVDPDTKLVFSHKIGRRDMGTGGEFMTDVRDRVSGAPQIATDNLNSYPRLIRAAFGYEGYSYGTETKNFGEPNNQPVTPADWNRAQRKPVTKLAFSTRKKVVGSPDLGSLTTCHIERVFLSVRQELVRFTRKTLAYSKDIDMHKLATALYFGVYNLVRRHKGIGSQTPAMAAGIEDRRWALEDVVALTEAYWKPKHADAARQAAAAKRIAEDNLFAKAMAELSNH